MSTVIDQEKAKIRKFMTSKKILRRKSKDKLKRY
jgi:hypothetical protein